MHRFRCYQVIIVEDQNDMPGEIVQIGEE